MNAIEECLRPKFGLLMFPDYMTLNAWLVDNLDNLLRINAAYNKALRTISFSNKSRLILGFGNKEEDFRQFISCEFDFVYGSDNPILLSRVRK